ncbi:hypothetical protein FGO68_gene15415 [Halteria grandinella]|uniref:Sulfite exporter TauE/SafE family protein n=1 Tax=Halteria grandinella TaxID=5974 RepID=A0A8J8T6V7_HALGN|nr:hypothetical protein FGO68_gene15415 [Halteria grandinella]
MRDEVYDNRQQQLSIMKYRGDNIMLKEASKAIAGILLTLVCLPSSYASLGSVPIFRRPQNDFSRDANYASTDVKSKHLNCFLDRQNELETSCPAPYPYQLCVQPEGGSKKKVVSLRNDTSEFLSGDITQYFGQIELDQKVLTHDGTCKHKSIWPILTMDVIGTIVLVIIMTLATMGGIGGGGVVVFLIKYLLYFSLKEAVALSNFSIFACSVARFFLTWSKRHPEKKDCVALDYGLATVMMPTVLIGSFIGNIFNLFLPDVMVQICLTLLLFFLTVQAIQTGRKTYKKEENEKAKALAAKKKDSVKAVAQLGVSKSEAVVPRKSKVENEAPKHESLLKASGLHASKRRVSNDSALVSEDNSVRSIFEQGHKKRSSRSFKLVNIRGINAKSGQPEEKMNMKGKYISQFASQLKTIKEAQKTNKANSAMVDQDDEPTKDKHQSNMHSPTQRSQQIQNVKYSKQINNENDFDEEDDSDNSDQKRIASKRKDEQQEQDPKGRKSFSNVVKNILGLRGRAKSTNTNDLQVRMVSINHENPVDQESQWDVSRKHDSKRSSGNQRSNSINIPDDRISMTLFIEDSSLVLKQSDAVKRREKLLVLAKERDQEQKVSNNLYSAAMARRLSTLKENLSEVQLTQNAEKSEKDLAILDQILHKEKSHLQWSKHLVCFVVLIAQVIVNLIRTQNAFKPSFFEKCQTYDFILASIYICICTLVTAYALRRNNYEQELKIKHQKGFCKSDLRFSPKIVRNLVSVALGGGWVSGALGLGGGAIFNPVLLSMGIPASVSGSTGMYLVMFSTLGSSFTYILVGQLNLIYGLWTSFWCIIFLLAFILGLSALLIPIFATIDMMAKLRSPDQSVREQVYTFDFDDVCSYPS